MSESSPSPDLFFDTITGYQRVGALEGALDLDLFTAIDPGGGTAADLAARCGASARGVRILCDYLTTLGFLVTHTVAEYEVMFREAGFSRVEWASLLPTSQRVAIGGR